MLDDAGIDALVVEMRPHDDAEPTEAGLGRLRASVLLDRRRRRRRVGVPVAGLALLASAAAGYAASSGSPEDASALTVACATDLSATVVTGLAPDGSRGPAQSCSAEWRAGRMQAGVTTVPPLQACVRAQEVFVFPETDACKKLSLPVFTGYSAVQEQAATLQAELRAADVGGCRALPAAEQDARRALERAGLSWSVVAVGSSATSSCVSLSVDLAGRHVLVLP